MVSTVIFVIMVTLKVAIGGIYVPPSKNEGFNENTITKIESGNTTTYLDMLFLPFAHKFNMLDGPARITQARTKPSKNIKPTVEEMKYYIYYAAAAYDAYIERMQCVYCYKIANDITDLFVVENGLTDVSALITLSTTREEIVIAYRGSQVHMNFIEDCIISQVNISGGVKLHKGFHYCALSVYEGVMTKVAEWYSANPTYKIVLTGHSAGAAMARITLYFCLELKQFDSAVYVLITYGEPRTGNKKFADYFNNLTIVSARVVSRADIIPHLPANFMLGFATDSTSYCHPQTEYWLNGDDTRWANQNLYEDPKASASIGPKYAVIDHLIYFDCQIALHTYTNPASQKRLPFFDPTKILPPLPIPVQIGIAQVLSNITSVVYPFIGR